LMFSRYSSRMLLLRCRVVAHAARTPDLHQVHAWLQGCPPERTRYSCGGSSPTDSIWCCSLVPKVRSCGLTFVAERRVYLLPIHPSWVYSLCQLLLFPVHSQKRPDISAGPLTSQGACGRALVVFQAIQLVVVLTTDFKRLLRFVDTCCFSV